MSDLISVDKKCSKCQIKINFENKVKNRNLCIECRRKYDQQWRDKNRTHVRESAKKSYYKRFEENPDRLRKVRRSNSLKKNYNISLTEYNSILISQNYVCCICKKTDKKNLAVDHDHKSLLIRGLLCARCNTVLGKVEDNIELLFSMIKYLDIGEIL